MNMQPMREALVREFMGPAVAPAPAEVTDKAQRRQLARGLLKAAQSFGSDKGSFLAAAGRAVPAGVAAYTDGMENAEKEAETKEQRDMEMKRRRALDQLRVMMSMNKDRRADSADTRASKRLTLDQARHGEQSLMNKARIRNLDADNARADRTTEASIANIEADNRRQQQKLDADLLHRQNLAIERGNREGRAAEAHNVRMKQARAQAEMDAIKLKAMQEGGATSSKDSAELRRHVEQAVYKFSRAQGLETDNYNLDRDKAQAAVDDYRKRLEKELGLKPLYGGQAGQNSASTPSVKFTPENPARPITQADFDALPPGSVFINPKDGKRYRIPEK